MQRPVSPINYKWTNEDIININYTINMKLLNAIINSIGYL